MKTCFAALLLLSATLMISGCGGSGTGSYDPGDAPAEPSATGGVEPTQNINP